MLARARSRHFAAAKEGRKVEMSCTPKTARSFYGSRVSTPATGSSKQRRRVDLAKAICASNDVAVSDSDMDLELSDQDLIDYDDEERNINESFSSTHSSQMYSFSDVSTPVASQSKTTNRATTDEASAYFKDLIQRQNLLILEMLEKQKSLNNTLEEVKTDLKETQSHVRLLFEEKRKRTSEDAGSKPKRKYPSSLTVCVTVF